MLRSLVALLVILLFACRDRTRESKQIDASYTDEKGHSIMEIAAGSTLQISSDAFRGFKPEDIRIKNIKIFIEGIEAPILALRDYKFVTMVPIINQTIAKDLKITVSIQDAVKELTKKIKYRPTISATPFAGIGADGKPNGIFTHPAEMVLDSKDNIYVIDQKENNHDRIIKVLPNGSASVFVGGDGSLGRLVGIGIAPQDSVLYFSDATAQQVKKVRLSDPAKVIILAGSGVAGNTNGQGTAASFRFGSKPVIDFGSNELGQGMTVDKNGNVYVGESANALFSGITASVRRITPDGIVSTVPGSVIDSPKEQGEAQSPGGITLNDNNEIVYTAGGSGFFQGIAAVTPGGTTRLAGYDSKENLIDGQGTKAAFCYPKALQFSDGYYWIADSENCAIRRMDKQGNVITIAGVGHGAGATKCLCPDYQTATAASTLWPSTLDKSPDAFIKAAKAIHIDLPGGIAVKNSGLMYFSDYGKYYRCIWKLTIK